MLSFINLILMPILKINFWKASVCKLAFFFSFFVAALFSKAKIASACSGIMYFLTYLPYAYMSIQEFMLNHRISFPSKLAAVSIRVIGKACFHYERGMELSLFILLIFYFFRRLSVKRSKKSIEEIKNTLFNVRNGSEP